MWNYSQGYIDVTMPQYIAMVLKKFATHPLHDLNMPLPNGPNPPMVPKYSMCKMTHSLPALKSKNAKSAK